MHQGRAMKRGERLGCYSQNREEAVVTELAAWSRSLPTVYLYDTLGDDSAQFITNHAEITFLVCSADKAARVVSLAAKCPLLRGIIVMGSHDLVATEGRLQVKTFEEVLAIGAQVLSNRSHASAEPQPPKPEDLLTILYTR